jgi:hypothetical protein
MQRYVFHLFCFEFRYQQPCWNLVTVNLFRHLRFLSNGEQLKKQEQMKAVGEEVRRKETAEYESELTENQNRNRQG